jgi:type II restriction/modification system DNA methylase subunit YeeA
LAGPFKVSSDTAYNWLKLPNPHGKPNSDVLRPIYNGSDITRRWAGDWVIDFGLMDEQEAALYEVPFAHVVEKVKPVRAGNREAVRAQKWWRFGRPRPELRTKLAGLSRYIATPETAKHRFFVWFPVSVAPEHSLIVIPSDDDNTFGVLSSRFHTLWALAAGGTLEDRPRYNSTVTFEPFPFPPAASDDAIAAAASTLNQLRERWLTPPEWIERVAEVVPGYPDRIIPKTGHEADLKKRTLTNLYNARPDWLRNAHKALDIAVASAYGWTDYTENMSGEEILRRLLALNLERSNEAQAT